MNTIMQGQTVEEHRDVSQAIAETIIGADEGTTTEVDGVREIDPRVLRGVALLDEKHPGWAQRINLDRFELRAIDNCVLGQLYERDYFKGVSQVLGNASEVVQEDFGFNVGYDGDDAEVERVFDLLEADWRVVIAERQR